MPVHELSPSVGVVIPVYNDWQRLQRCLEALAAQNYPRERLHVRVVDNGSNDWPSQPSFPLPLEVIVHPHPGSYGARNRAALDWAVDVLGWDMIIHTIAPENEASKAVARRLGSRFLHMGRLPEPFHEKPVEIWGQSRDEWRARRGAGA